jgi:hypothetical protein
MPDRAIAARPALSGERYHLAEPPQVISERVDSVPLLLAVLERMGVQRLIDGHIANQSVTGLSHGWVATIWLAALLSQHNARPDTVCRWVEQRQECLRRCTGQPVYSHDFSGTRLREMLRALDDDTCWGSIEVGLNQELRSYDLDPEPVRLLSDALAQAQLARANLQAHLAQAKQELNALNNRRRGKFTRVEDLRRAAEAIVAEHRLEAILRIQCEEQVLARSVRRYRGRPGSVRVEREVSVTFDVDTFTLSDVAWRLGWWVYATTAPIRALAATQMLLAYRSAYLIEYGGDDLGMLFDLDGASPAVRSDGGGFVRLLTIGMRVMALLDRLAPPRYADDLPPERLVGSPAFRSQPTMSGEQLLAAFQDVTLTILKGSRWTSYVLTPLDPSQQRILQSLDLPPDIYTHLWADRIERAVAV